MERDLKEKAIDIQGKQYVLVSDRVIFFNENYPKGCIITEIKTEGTKIFSSAKVYPEGLEGRFFTGHSQEIEGSSFINKNSAVENAETSSVGRALAMMGIGVIDSIASVDEINKANNRIDEPAYTPVNKTFTPVQKPIQASVCPKCGAEMVLNPKTGKVFCKDKCWTKDYPNKGEILNGLDE